MNRQNPLAWLIGVHPDDPVNLRINIDTCEPCPDNQISNETTGECEVCPNTAIGNTCQSCTPDDVHDGSTMDLDVYSYDTNQSGGVCPNVFTLRVHSIDALQCARSERQRVELLSASQGDSPTKLSNRSVMDRHISGSGHA